MPDNKYNFIMQSFMDLPVNIPHFEGNTDNNNYLKHFSIKEESILIDDEKQILCPICYDKIKDQCYIEDCLHKFCYQCINIWKKNKCKCPICRAKIKKIIKIHKNLVCCNKKKILK